jgi:hypothetical protein
VKGKWKLEIGNLGLVLERIVVRWSGDQVVRWNIGTWNPEPGTHFFK